MLARSPYEFTCTKACDRLAQPTLELIAFHLPLRSLQTSLKREGIGWGSQQAGKNKEAQAHVWLQGKQHSIEVSVRTLKT
ncbi:3-ketoacyl-ACP/CoA reductase [Pseudomonas sp. MT-1]|nr:3-ketoacyl-ACP/CoA reductase [Pseudomonas sp. MT-1]